MFARLCLLGILAMGAFAAPAIGMDASAPAGQQAGGWHVWGGCFTPQPSRNGPEIGLGIDADRSSLYIVLGRSGLSAVLVMDFKERTGFRIPYRGTPIAQLALSGAYAALAEMASCRRA